MSYQGRRLTVTSTRQTRKYGWDPSRRCWRPQSNPILTLSDLELQQENNRIVWGSDEPRSARQRREAFAPERVLEFEGQLTVFLPDQPSYHETPDKTLGNKDNFETIPPTQLNRCILPDALYHLHCSAAPTALSAGRASVRPQPQALEASTKSNTYIK